MATKKTTRKKAAAKSGAPTVAEKQTDESQLPVALNYGDDMGSGIDDVSQDEMLIPFLAALHYQCPQIAGDTKIEGAQPGMLFNTVTQELHDGAKGILFVPAVRHHVFVEWLDRDKGGGVVGVHEPESEVVTAAKASAESYGKYKSEAGNALVETFYLYGITLDEDQDVTGFAVVAFTGMRIKPYKAMITSMRHLMVPVGDGRKANPPLFANLLRLRTVPDSNPKGAFFNFKLSWANGKGIESLISPDSEAYSAAKQLAAAYASGEAKADHDGAAATNGGSSDSAEGDDSVF